MPRYVAFLRAINVGGHHTVKMDRLRQLFEQLGLSNVETFIASGNVIFDSPARDTAALARRIERHLYQSLGYGVATLIRATSELAAVAGYDAFPESDTEGCSLSIGFLADAPEEAARQKVMSLGSVLDEFHVRGRELYWLCHTRVSESAVSGAQLEKALGMPTTMRNVTTVRKLAAKYGARA